MLDIKDEDLDLPDVFTDNSLFTQSWVSYWTTLPDPSGSSLPAPLSSPLDAPASSPGLGTCTRVGIGLGAAAVALLAIGVVLLYIRHRRRSTVIAPPIEPYYEHDDKPQSVIGELEQPVAEMQPNAHNWTYELPTPTPQLGSTTPKIR
jgi:hypothetical protein